MRIPASRFLAAALVVAAAGLLFADDGKQGPSPLEQFEKKYAAYKTKIADEFFSLGDALHKKKQYATAKTEFEAALLHDPDHAKSRQKLGFKKGAGGWERDSSIKVYTANDDKGDPDGRVADKHKSDRAKAEKKLADEAYKLGKWSADAKLAEPSVKMYREAIDWDNNHADARKALGHRKEGVKWITPEEDGDRKKREEAAKATETGAEAATDPDLEKGVGIKFSTRKSTHFTVSAYFSQEQTGKMIRAGEMAFKEFHELFDLDVNAPLLNHIGAVFVKTKEQHDIYLANVIGLSGEHLEFQKKYGRHTDFQRLRIESHHGEEAEPDFPQDFMIHDTYHVLFSARYGGGDSIRGWLYECPAYWFSAKLNASADCVCVGGESFASGASRGLSSDPHYWPQTVKDLVNQAKDPEMHATLKSTINSLTGEMIAKGWSVWDFMVKAHKPKLLKFLDYVSSGNEQEEALKSAFGWDYSELDHQWEKWVRENY